VSLDGTPTQCAARTGTQRALAGVHSVNLLYAVFADAHGVARVLSWFPNLRRLVAPRDPENCLRTLEAVAACAPDALAALDRVFLVDLKTVDRRHVYAIRACLAAAGGRFGSGRTEELSGVFRFQQVGSDA